MAGVKEIRRRIRAVKNTQQITKAMELVAAAKLRKVQERVVAARPYARQLRTVLGRLATARPAPAGLAEAARPLTVARRAERVAGHLATGGGRGDGRSQADHAPVGQRPAGGRPILDRSGAPVRVRLPFRRARAAKRGTRGGGPAVAGAAAHPLMAARERKRVMYVVITGDRGLAGAYNANVIRRAAAELARERQPVHLLPVGRKARDHFKKRGLEVVTDFVGVGDEVGLAEARVMARRFMDSFLRGEVDEVRLVYTEFVSALVQRPQVLKLLPVEAPAGAAEAAAAAGPGVAAAEEYIYEPGPGDVLERLLPRYVEMLVYHVLLEAKASEHGARMTAMRSATDNAAELIEELTLDFNRARQASITKELMDIVGGAEALKQS